MDSEIRPGLSADLTDRLDDLSDAELHAAIDYCQDRLRAVYEGLPTVEALPGEELVSVDEHDGYTEVVKSRRCVEGCADCPHGPYLYHVTREPNGDGEEKLKWRYLGRVEGE